jgi:Domain of unknown function (DUF4189)/Putative peptidoglycan binding domain
VMTDAHSPEVRAEAGNRVNMLKEIRSRLYELNFDPDRVDGQGNDLRQAIREFEKINKMAETGKPTAELLRRLREVGPLQPWGAIVYACKDIVYACRDKKWGMSWSEDTRRAAVASARETCGTPERCPTEISFFGTGCGVFARSDSIWSIVASDSIQQAKERALSECSSKGARSCRIFAAVCADGTERYVHDKE